MTHNLTQELDPHRSMKRNVVNMKCDANMETESRETYDAHTHLYLYLTIAFVYNKHFISSIRFTREMECDVGCTETVQN